MAYKKMYTADPGDNDLTPATTGFVQQELDLRKLAVYVGKTGTQSIPNATTPETVLSWNTEPYDFGGFHDTLTNNSRLTAPTTGVYSITAYINFQANSTGVRYVTIRKNAAGSGSGGSFLFAETANAVTSPTSTGITCAHQVYLTSGEYVEAFAYQNSGALLGVANDSTFAMSMQVYNG